MNVKYIYEKKDSPLVLSVTKENIKDVIKLVDSYVRFYLKPKIETLEIDDSYIRFTLEEKQNLWLEAPAYARVVNEQLNNNSRIVTYKTEGLTINKTF